jgi:hypothetical protein
MTCDATDDELPPVEYLRDLADRIFQIPVKHGVDQGDHSRLLEIARSLEDPLTEILG